MVSGHNGLPGLHVQVIVSGGDNRDIDTVTHHLLVMEGSSVKAESL